jgi:hypothetical protein
VVKSDWKQELMESNRRVRCSTKWYDDALLVIVYICFDAFAGVCRNCRKNETACNWLIEGHKSSVSETRFNTQIKENKGPHPSLSKKKKGPHPSLIMRLDLFYFFNHMWSYVFNNAKET